MDAGGVVSALSAKARPVGRTARVVAALILAMGAMTLGLLLLEPAGRIGSWPASAAIRTPSGALTHWFTQTNIPIQTQNWRRAVVVAAAINSPGSDQPFCHFVVHPDGQVEPTDAWINQVRAGRDDDRVHILMRAEWSASYPPRVQNETLVSLLRLVYQLGQPREWQAELDYSYAPAAQKRMDWMHKVAANVVALPDR